MYFLLLLVLLWGYPHWVSFGMWLIIMSARHCRKRVASICLAIMRVWEWYHFRQTDEIGQNDSDLWQLMCNCSLLNQKHSGCGWFPLTVMSDRRVCNIEVPSEVPALTHPCRTIARSLKCSHKPRMTQMLQVPALNGSLLCFHFFSSLSFVP